MASVLKDQFPGYMPVLRSLLFTMDLHAEITETVVRWRPGNRVHSRGLCDTPAWLGG